MLHSGTSGVDWEQAFKVLKVLLISPVVGFGCAALLMLLSKRLIKYPRPLRGAQRTSRRPFPIRALMVLTCTGVSFFHGSNDGQKGMGLIMLILIGTVPTAYALNHAVTAQDIQDFIAASEQAGTSSIATSTRPPACSILIRSTRRSHRLHPHQAAAARHHPSRCASWSKT
jgi:PiT family inorganic phosphate transporter